MKTTIRFGLFFTILAQGLYSCINLDTQSPEDGKASSEYMPVDLSQYDINLRLMLEDSMVSNCSILWNANFGRLEVSIGNGIDFFITEDGPTLFEKSEELKRGIFTYGLEIDNENELLYTLSLPDGTYTYYHYFANFNVGNRNFSFESNPLVEMSHDHVVKIRSIIMQSIAESSDIIDNNLPAS